MVVLKLGIHVINSLLHNVQIISYLFKAVSNVFKRSDKLRFPMILLRFMNQISIEDSLLQKFLKSGVIFFDQIIFFFDLVKFGKITCIFNDTDSLSLGAWQ